MSLRGEVVHPERERITKTRGTVRERSIKNVSPLIVTHSQNRRKKIIFYYIIQQYRIGSRDSTAPTESQTGSRTLHNGPQYKTGATKE